MNEASLKALLSYLKGTYQPSGTWDGGGRWYPDENESCSCCTSIRSPSRAYPWSIWNHCKSIKHIKAVLTEKPLGSAYATALNMTKETAPLFINDVHPAIKAVALKLLGR